MLYALPLSIFSNMVMTPRHIVSDHGPGRRGYHPGADSQLRHSLYWSPAICFDATSPSVRWQALAIGSPAVPFIGTSVLAFYLAPRQRVADHVSSITAKRLPAAAGDDTDVGRHRR